MKSHPGASSRDEHSTTVAAGIRNASNRDFDGWLVPAPILPRCEQVTVNLKTLGVGDVTGEDCVLGFDNRQYQVIENNDVR